MRKCSGIKSLKYKIAQDAYKKGDKMIKICESVTEIKRIGEASSDSDIFTGLCVINKNKKIAVAIKITSSDPSTELCVLLNRELRDSKVVPEVYDFFQSGNNYVIVMELLGMSLCRYIAANKDTSKYKSIVSQVVSKLKIFHENGFIHGDFHCNNIMIKDGEVYFIDFDRMGKDDSISHDVNFVIDSLYGFPLDFAKKMYGYGTEEYELAEERVSLFESLLREKFKKEYKDVEIDEDDSDDEDSEDSEDEDSDEDDWGIWKGIKNFFIDELN